jgi:CubicO group peptidase (beta-lactamase class C family)
MDPNDWGLGFELRDTKEPHWTGTRNSPRTYGHFGGSGSFLWLDPEPGDATPERRAELEAEGRSWTLDEALAYAAEGVRPSAG